MTYFVKDPEGNVSDQSVTIPITVTPMNDRPRGPVSNIAVETWEHEEISFSTADDWGEGDEYVYQELIYTILTQPEYGSIASTGWGGWTYTPPALDYSSGSIAETFSYTVTDDEAAGPSAMTSDPITGTVTLKFYNDNPVAAMDFETVLPGGTVTFNVLGNDWDYDLDHLQTDLSLTSIDVFDPLTGAIDSWNADGTVTFTATVDYQGEAGLIYQVMDPLSGSGAEMVSIVVGYSLLARGTPPGTAAADNIEADSLLPLVAEARARWNAAGFDTSALDGVTIRRRASNGTSGGNVTREFKPARRWSLPPAPSGCEPCDYFFVFLRSLNSSRVSDLSLFLSSLANCFLAVSSFSPFRLPRNSSSVSFLSESLSIFL